jgi:hypothetical protein
MSFLTRNGADDPTERMRITSGGNMVMGNNAGSAWSTSSTRTTLEIYGGSYPMALHNSLSVGNSISYNTYWDGTNWRYVGAAASVIYIQDSEGHKFLQNGSGSAGASFTPTERMRITSGGNVGIGTINPATQLNVGHESHGLGLSYIPESSLPAIAGIFTNTSFGQQGYGSLLVKSRTDYAGYSISFYTAGIANDIQERMRITSGGTAHFKGGSLDDINTTAIRVDNRKFLTFYNAADNGWAFGLVADSSNNGALVANNNMIFGTGSSATERMRITSGGNVIAGYNQTTTTTIGRTFATTHASANRGATLFYGINDGGNGGMFVYNVAAAVGALNSQYISFETHEGGISAGERMRITSDGKVIVRQSNFTYPVSIEAQAGGGQLALTRGGAYTEFYMGGTTSGGTVLYVRSGGSGGVYLATGSTGWVANSDERLKTDLVPIENGLEKVVSLRSVIGRYLTDSIDKKRPFLIAQDVKKVLPGAVMTNEETGDMGLSYTEVIPLLVASIKELKAENNLLKARLDNNNIN